MKKIIFILVSLVSISLYSQIVKDNYKDYKYRDYNDTIEELRYNNVMKLYRDDIQIKNTIYHTVIDTLCFDSIWFCYYSNGKVCLIKPYKNGLLNGYFDFYWFNGQLGSRYRMINDKIKDGYYFTYNPDGSIYEEGRIKKGKRVGNWYESFTGNLSRLHVYNRNGILIDEKKWNGDKKKWERGYDATIFEKIQIFFWRYF